MKQKLSLENLKTIIRCMIEIDPLLWPKAESRASSCNVILESELRSFFVLTRLNITSQMQLAGYKEHPNQQETELTLLLAKQTPALTTNFSPGLQTLYSDVCNRHHNSLTPESKTAFSDASTISVYTVEGPKMGKTSIMEKKMSRWDQSTTPKIILLHRMIIFHVKLNGWILNSEKTGEQ